MISFNFSQPLVTFCCYDNQKPLATNLVCCNTSNMSYIW